MVIRHAKGVMGNRVADASLYIENPRASLQEAGHFSREVQWDASLPILGMALRQGLVIPFGASC
jgi:hypothetical protein